MRKKKKGFPAIRNFNILVLMILLSLLFTTCKNENNKKVSASTPPDTSRTVTNGQNFDDPVFKLPVFEVARTEIEKYIGAGKKNPKKFLIRFEFDDITEPASINSKLLLYPAKDHKDFAAKQKPLEVPAINEYSQEMNSNIIFGNNEFDVKNLLMPGGGLKNFISLRFTPHLILGEDGRNNHLTYTVTLIAEEKQVIEDLGDANPSPPKAPNYN